jgi:hypothetical protein
MAVALAVIETLVEREKTGRAYTVGLSQPYKIIIEKYPYRRE